MCSHVALPGIHACKHESGRMPGRLPLLLTSLGKQSRLGLLIAAAQLQRILIQLTSTARTVNHAEVMQLLRR